VLPEHRGQYIGCRGASCLFRGRDWMEEDLQIAHLDVKAIKKILHPAHAAAAE